MRNITPVSAVGGTLYASGDDDASLFGIKARYRHWLSETGAIDIAPGILLAGSDNHGVLQFPGFVASITITHADWLGLTVQYQAISGTCWSPVWDELDLHADILDGVQSSVYIGARFGSYLAIAMPVVLMIIVAIQMADEPMGMGS